MDRPPTNAEVLQLLENHKILVQSCAALERQRTQIKQLATLLGDHGVPAADHELEIVELQVREIKSCLAQDQRNLAQLLALTVQINVQIASIKLLEEIGQLLQPSRSSEPRITYWLSAPIAYMLSEEQREEWLGDLQEVNREMMRKGYPEWMISIVNVGQIIRLIVSSLDIKIVDLILKLRGKA